MPSIRVSRFHVLAIAGCAVGLALAIGVWKFAGNPALHSYAMRTLARISVWLFGAGLGFAVVSALCANVTAGVSKSLARSQNEEPEARWARAQVYFVQPIGGVLGVFSVATLVLGALLIGYISIRAL